MVLSAEMTPQMEKTSMIWYVKLVTDPLTDVITYSPRRQRA